MCLCVIVSDFVPDDMLIYFGYGGEAQTSRLQKELALYLQKPTSYNMRHLGASNSNIIFSRTLVYVLKGFFVRRHDVIFYMEGQRKWNWSATAMRCKFYSQDHLGEMT